MLTEEIAKLTGRLEWKVDNRPLLAFEKRLDKVHTKIKEFAGLANKRVTLKIGVDMRGLSAKIKLAESMKISLRNVEVSNATIAELGHKLAARLDTTPIRLANVKLDISKLIEQKRLAKQLFAQMQLEVPVAVKLGQTRKSLLEWKKMTEEKFKLHLNADISRQKFYQNAKATINSVVARIGTINLQTPKITLKVDRAALRREIQDVLATIRREAKIQISLTGTMASGGGGTSRAHATRTGMAAGVGSGLMGLGRGFVPGLGAAFAVSQLNQINQQLRAQDLAMTAVTGSESAGKAQMTWLKNLSQNIGLDYRQSAAPFTKMLASGLTSGMSTESVQNIFKGVSEYGRVMGLDSESMKGSLKAIEQMMNKGQVMS